MKLHSQLMLATIFCASTTALYIAPASEQDAEEEAVIEEIMVTGSRIAR